MAISICSPQLGLSPESNSGGEVYDREVISRLCKKGVKVFTLLPKNKPYLKHNNLVVNFAPIQPMVPPHIFSAFVLPYLIRTYQKEKFDILRLHNPYFVGPAAVAFQKIYPKIPIVASYLHLESGINHLIDKVLVNHFNHIITISKATKNEIINSLNYPGEKISVAYPGVDDCFQPRKPDLQHHKGKKFTIMFVGGLKPRKNPAFLLKVIAKLNHLNVQLIYAGTGPLKNKLAGSNVNITGYIPKADLPKIYHQASVIVLPSLKEGFGMTLAEAGASGLPVVGNNHSSIKEVIQDGKTGFLAETNNVNEWVSKLLQLVKSPRLCHQMGENAQKFVRSNFTWEKNINTHLKIYESLVS